MRQLSVRTSLILMWLIAAAAAVGVCSLLYPGTQWHGESMPIGNDSFYHARRILDTAADPSSFYQFDKKIHAPEGSLLTWPWGYDYAMGWLVRLVVKAGFSAPPINFLIWVPVGCVVISVALMMLVARRLSLSPWSAGLAGLCVALSPLTQVLHGVGMIDHHFAEYIFVLATLALGLKWFAMPENHKAGAALGVLLGVAPAIHNGLFVLQLPVLTLMLLWWVQDIRIPRRAALFFAVALLASTIAILLPSLPFRLGRFEFWTLSWFHLYAALGTAATAVLLSAFSRTRKNVGLLLFAAAVYLLPLGHQFFVAHSFLAGKIARLDVISEMQSVRQMAEIGGLRYPSTLYSLFLWLWPFTVAFCAWRAWVERSSGRLFFWIAALCGLSLLIMQFRLHYFGSFALFLPWLVLTEDLAERWSGRRRFVMLSVSLVFLLMFSMPLRWSIPAPPELGGTGNFPALRLVLEDLQKACAKEPGVVLADNDAGHFIRYYTECSVISNNFLLTRQHEEKIEWSDYLLSLGADDMPKAAPYIRYVLMRPVTIEPTEGGPMYVTFSQGGRATLLSDLLIKPYDQVSNKYVGLREVVMRWTPKEQPVPYMRLFKVLKAGEQPEPRVAQTTGQ